MLENHFNGEVNTGDAKFGQTQDRNWKCFCLSSI